MVGEIILFFLIFAGFVMISLCAFAGDPIDYPHKSDMQQISRIMKTDDGKENKYKTLDEEKTTESQKDKTIETKKCTCKHCTCNKQENKETEKKEEIFVELDRDK